MTRTRLAAVAIGAALVVGAPVTSSAHANYRSSTPKHEEELARAPLVVSADYSERLADNSKMLILDHCDRRVDDGNIVIVGYRMTVGLDADHPSQYTVHWKATSEEDGHDSFGRFWFTVRGDRASCPSTREPEPSADPSPPPKRGRGSDQGARPTPGPAGPPDEPDGRGGGPRTGGPRSPDPPAPEDPVEPLSAGEVVFEAYEPPSLGAPMIAIALALGALPLLAGRRRQ